MAVRFYDEDTNGSQETQYYLQDANFNVTAVTDDSGTVLERYHYTPYGEVTFLEPDFDAISASVIGNTHLFTGRERDPETGLQLNRERYYHAPLGRWTTQDPIGYAAGDANLYGYVGSSPTRWVDPTGRQAQPLPSPSPGKPPLNVVWPPEAPVSPTPSTISFNPFAFFYFWLEFDIQECGRGSEIPWNWGADDPDSDPDPDPDPCFQGFINCLGTALADKPGSVQGESACASCYAACNASLGGWPAKIPGTTIRCDYWNF